ncbi:NB-ARC domains-containing protein [Tanacetum coccineum]
MKFLDGDKSLELFYSFAFEEKNPSTGFKGLASQVIIHLQGHPLALKIFGRLLYDKSVHVWKSELDRLQTCPNSDILQKLRPSFDGLASDHKDMFLDIACAFIGENKKFAASVLDNTHCSANAIIEVLADKFLITHSAYNKRLKNAMKIDSEACNEIKLEEIRGRNHRRLWISSEDYDVLNVKKKKLKFSPFAKEKLSKYSHRWTSSNTYEKLADTKNLFSKSRRTLAAICSKLLWKTGVTLSINLTVCYWHGLPLKFLPSVFYPENIVTIDLSYSHIKHLWTTPKELTLEGCENLVKVHRTIGTLKKLVVLNMRNCKRLKSFPSKLEMVFLQILILSGCLKMEKLPEDLGRIKSLTELHIDRTSITELPLFGKHESIRSRWWTSVISPFGLLSKQQHPQRSVSLAGFHMLKSLNLSYCKLEQVPESIGGLSHLIFLYLEGNNFTCLPASLSQLSHLQHIFVDGCKKLEVLNFHLACIVLVHVIAPPYVQLRDHRKTQS